MGANGLRGRDDAVRRGPLDRCGAQWVVGASSRRGARVAILSMAISTHAREVPAADRVIDARGMACPGPLLEAKRGVLLVPVGGVLEIISSNEETNIDVPAWAWKVGHTYLGTVHAAGVWRIFVRRNK